MAKLIIPTPLRKFTDNQANIETNSNTVIGAIQQLTEKYPDLKEHLFDDNQKLRAFVRVYVGDEDIKSLNQENTKVQPDSVISIIPAIAGGTVIDL